MIDLVSEDSEPEVTDTLGPEVIDLESDLWMWSILWSVTELGFLR